MRFHYTPHSKPSIYFNKHHARLSVMAQGRAFDLSANLSCTFDLLLLPYPALKQPCMLAGVW